MHRTFHASLQATAAPLAASGQMSAADPSDLVWADPGKISFSSKLLVLLAEADD